MGRGRNRAKRKQHGQGLNKPVVGTSPTQSVASGGQSPGISGTSPNQASPANATAQDSMIEVILKILGSTQFVALVSLLSAVAAGYSAKYAFQGNKLSHCRAIADSLGPALDHLNDFLRDPHEERLGWEFYHNLAKYLGPGAVVRRNILGRLSPAPSACGPVNETRNWHPKDYTASYPLGASTARDPGLVATGDATTASVKVGGSSAMSPADGQASILANFNTDTSDSDDADCLLTRAQLVAEWLDGSPTKGHVLATAVAREPKEIKRTKEGVFGSFSCKREIPKEACNKFQNKLNELIASAFLVRRQLMTRVETCDVSL